MRYKTSHVIYKEYHCTWLNVWLLFLPLNLQLSDILLHVYLEPLDFKCSCFTLPCCFSYFLILFYFYMIVKNLCWCKCNIHVWQIKVNFVDQFTSSAYSIYFLLLSSVSISPFTRWTMYVFLDDTFYLCSYQMHWERR